MSSTKGGLFHHPKAPDPTPKMSVSDCFVKLNRIRADDDKIRGNCISCAAETVTVLKSPPSYEPKSVDALNANSDDSHVFADHLRYREFSTDEEPAAAIQEVLTYLRGKEQEPGSIFVADTEDHFYVLFKSFNNQIYLLDSDSHYYCKINDERDFEVKEKSILEEGDSSDETGLYNFITKTENGTFTLKFMGLADPSWKIALEPIEKDGVALVESGEESKPIISKPPL